MTDPRSPAPTRPRASAPTRPLDAAPPPYGPFSLVAVLGARVVAGADRPHVIGQPAARLPGEVGEPTEEPGLEGVVEAQHVVEDQDLAVAADARADADGGHRGTRP